MATVAVTIAMVFVSGFVYADSVTYTYQGAALGDSAITGSITFDTDSGIYYSDTGKTAYSSFSSWSFSWNGTTVSQSNGDTLFTALIYTNGTDIVDWYFGCTSYLSSTGTGIATYSSLTGMLFAGEGYDFATNNIYNPYATVKNENQGVWTQSTSPVPEPVTMLLLGLGLVGLAGFRRKIKK